MIKCKFANGDYEVIDEKSISSDDLLKLKLRIREEVSNINLKLNLNPKKDADDPSWLKRTTDALNYRNSNLELIRLEEIRRKGEDTEATLGTFFMKVAHRELPPALYATIYQQADKLMQKEMG